MLTVYINVITYL